MNSVELTAPEYRKLIDMVAAAGSVDKLAALVRKGQLATKRGLVHPKTTNELVALRRAGIITEPEARRLLGLRGSKAATTGGTTRRARR